MSGRQEVFAIIAVSRTSLDLCLAVSHSIKPLVALIATFYCFAGPRCDQRLLLLSTAWHSTSSPRSVFQAPPRPLGTLAFEERFPLIARVQALTHPMYCCGPGTNLHRDRACAWSVGALICDPASESPPLYLPRLHVAQCTQHLPERISCVSGNMQSEM